jgi:hypothetical protein
MSAEEVKINKAAFKHGCTKADILRAIETCKYDHLLDGFDNKYLLIGFDKSGNLLEIVYNVLDGDIINVFHAMKCRKSYQDFLGIEVKK